jgi:tubulin-specific chaperone D
MIAGVLATVANMLKCGSRKVMIHVTEGACAHVSCLVASGELNANSLGRKLALKVLQRCALTLLDPLRMNSIARDSSRQKRQGMRTQATASTEVLALTQVGMRVLPQTIDALLNGLRDGDTVVRWSAAKGLGRIAARLPSTCVEDVNDAILELLSPLEGDGAWQGACLALAEVARQGLLPVQRLPQVGQAAPTAMRGWATATRCLKLEPAPLSEGVAVLGRSVHISRVAVHNGCAAGDSSGVPGAAL